MNGGETWSSWYNQPTGQFYHVAADNAFPYRVCSGQQENGSVCVSSRGNYGAISDRDWLPVGVDEYGYVAPDPLDPDIVFGGRSVTRFDRRTGQVSVVGPVGGGRGGVGGPPGTFRQVRTMPVVFSEVDKRALFFANNHLWKTVDGGKHWKQISPDLTRQAWDDPEERGQVLRSAVGRKPPSAGSSTPSRRPTRRSTAIWVGTDDGLIHVTADNGVTWKDVTPPAVGPWAKVSIIDAGRFDPLTAYAAINTLRLDDLRPHILRTHDGGKTWTEIVNGIPNGETVNAVREDPKRKGLLFAGTERAVYVSFDDGANWQSLRLNMAVSSVRDIIVKDDDLVAATHGRGLLDSRQHHAAAADRRRRRPIEDAILFKPATAWRVRWNTSVDMPWPERGGDGAESSRRRDDRLLPEGRRDRAGDAGDPAAGRPPGPPLLEQPIRSRRFPSRPPRRRRSTGIDRRRRCRQRPGMHRFMWDVHYQPLARPRRAKAGSARCPRSCRFRRFPSTPSPRRRRRGSNPGTYTMKLTVNGKTHSRSRSSSSRIRA